MQLPRRGRLSSIDLLPPEAQEDVEWALKELAARKQTQEDILESFNLRLAVKGLGPISKSAFNRHSLRTAKHAFRMGETRAIAAVLATKFEEGTDEKLTILVSETIKTLIFEMLENAGTLKANALTAEMMFNLAGALKSAEQAEKVAADKKKVVKKDLAELAKEQASAAIDRVAALKGLSAEAKEAFRRELFGIIDGR
jgi:hypothetical protein